MQHSDVTRSIVRRHVSGVLAAAGSALLLFVLVHHVLGVELEPVAGPRVTVGSVLGVSIVSAGLGWALLSGLEAWTTRGRTWWTRVAVAVTLLSLVGPLTTPDLTTEGRVFLSLLHLVVGGVTIGVLLSAPEPGTACDCADCAGTEARRQPAR